MKHMERIPLSTPVNREARLGISLKEYREMSQPSRFVFRSGRDRVFNRPRFVSFPDKNKHLRGKRIGAVTVVGYVTPHEAARHGWTNGLWVVRCDCGAYENRKQRDLLRPANRREYVDACTVCRGAWAEIAKNNFKKTGIVPNGGLPTHTAFKVSESPSHKVKPRVRVKMERQEV